MPYDPLASDTDHALTPPSAAHCSAPIQVGRDIFSRIIVATRLDLGIAVASVALAFAIGTLARPRGRLFRRLDRPCHRPYRRTIMAFPLFVLAMGIVAALGNTLANIVYATAIINLPIYASARPHRGQRPARGRFVEAARLAATARRASSWRSCCPTSCP